MSGRNVKQQINIMFCIKIGKNAIEKLTLQRNKAFSVLERQRLLLISPGGSSKYNMMCTTMQEIGNPDQKEQNQMFVTEKVG